MGKASSAKKVARAARAGGGRRPGQRRNLGFPLTVFLVVGVGVALVLFARTDREANAQPLRTDHWHVAYGLFNCDTFERVDPGLTDVGQDTLGIHTHGDNVIHIHPFLDSAAGRGAQLQLFLDQVGVQITDSKVTFPDGEVWEEGVTKCGDADGQLQVGVWFDAQDAADGDPPNEVVTEDFGAIRFRDDRMYITIAFVPTDTELPARPNIISDLNNLSDVAPAEGDSSTTTPGDGSATSSTVAGDTSSSTDTTAPGDTTSTTAGG